MNTNIWSYVTNLDWKTIAGVLGVILTFINIRNSVNQKKVKLRIRPTHAIAVPSGKSAFSIEVINLSAFPITLNDVGFTQPKAPLFREPTRQAVMNPMIADGKRLPRRIEPRESLSFYFDPYIFHGRKIDKAYARTTCGETRYGTSPALKQLKELVNG